MFAQCLIYIVFLSLVSFLSFYLVWYFWLKRNKILNTYMQLLCECMKIDCEIGCDARGRQLRFCLGHQITHDRHWMQHKSILAGLDINGTNSTVLSQYHVTACVQYQVMYSIYIPFMNPSRNLSTVLLCVLFLSGFWNCHNISLNIFTLKAWSHQKAHIWANF